MTMKHSGEQVVKGNRREGQIFEKQVVVQAWPSKVLEGYGSRGRNLEEKGGSTHVLSQILHNYDNQFLLAEGNRGELLKNDILWNNRCPISYCRSPPSTVGMCFLSAWSVLVADSHVLLADLDLWPCLFWRLGCWFLPCSCWLSSFSCIQWMKLCVS